APIRRLHDFAETCVFSKQSPGTFLCDHPQVATLLPKLRVHFAEFLNECSHKRLRILTPPTCVGLRYGQWSSYAERGFSWHLGSETFFRPEGRTFVPAFTLNAARICLSGGLYDGSTGHPSPVSPTRM